MKKTVYSLVLGEEVVREVDRRAYKTGTSRSNLINQLLAEHMGLVTDERRMGEVYAHARKLSEDIAGLQISLQSDTVLVARTALNYKYNPSMRYATTLVMGEDGLGGRIKASLRSQNRELLFHLRRFFALWSKIEQAYGSEPRIELDGGWFIRRFTIPERLAGDSARQAGMIVAYIAAMDVAFAGYFKHVADLAVAVKDIERIYLEYLKEHKDVI